MVPTFELAAVALAAVALIAFTAVADQTLGSVQGAKPTEPDKTPSPPRPPVFSIRALSKAYPTPAGSVTAIHAANIEIGEGLTAIVGPSGGGKTTLLNCIGGLDAPSGGEVWFRGVRLDFDDAQAMRHYRAAVVAWVFQELNLITHQTVVENVALPLLCRGVSRSQALATALRMLKALGIAHLAERSHEQLSRGQQQRAAIARAFASEAAVVLADEPTGSLDPETAENVMREFQRMSHDNHKPVVLVTHNHDLARRYCDRVLVCAGGGLQELDDEEPVPQAAESVLLDDTPHPKTGSRSVPPPAPQADRSSLGRPAPLTSPNPRYPSSPVEEKS